jgi:hypothetical protein
MVCLRNISVDTLHKGNTEDDDDDDDNNIIIIIIIIIIEMQRMWNLECTIIPVIIGAPGIVTRSLRKNLEAVP